MKAAILTRTSSTDQGTFGRLLFGENACYTTELPWRANRQGKSCIPVGIYTCALVRSPSKGMVYGVQHVPGRANVLIHTANLAGDADLGWTTELQGCIAPCLKLGVMRNKSGKWQLAGLISRPAVRNLMDWAKGEPFTLEIV